MGTLRLIALFTVSTVGCVEVHLPPDGTNQPPEPRSPERQLEEGLPAFDSFSFVRTCADGLPIVEITAALSWDVAPAALDCGTVEVPSGDAEHLVLTLDPFPLQPGEQLIDWAFREAVFCNGMGCVSATDATVIVGQDDDLRAVTTILRFDDEVVVVESGWVEVCGGGFTPDCWQQGS